MNSKDSVVRILCSNIEYNWLQPYLNDNIYESSGTGFFIKYIGDKKNSYKHILTCFHVIESAKKIYVTVSSKSKEKYEAEIISVCPKLDLALIKIKGYSNKKYMKLGDSDKIKPGDGVNALGYPMSSTKLKVTNGIISGFSRYLLQTDTAINSGNSGGPLVLKSTGQVIGINSEKIASFFADNIGYAIPIFFFKNIINLMKKNKVIHKPKFYCEFNNSDFNLFSYYSINGKSNCKSGYHITKIFKASNFYNKLSDGDVLCTFDNYKIDNFGESCVKWSKDPVYINHILYRYNLGDSVKIIYIDSKGKVKNTKITFSLPKFKIRERFPDFETIPYEIIGGIVLMDLSYNHIYYRNKFASEQRKALSKYFSIDGRYNNALIITYILQGSYIHKLENIRKGDIISHINKKKVSTLDDLKKILRKERKKKYLTIDTLANNHCVLNIKDLLKEEVELSKNHKYQLSDSYKALKKIK